MYHGVTAGVHAGADAGVHGGVDRGVGDGVRAAVKRSDAKMSYTHLSSLGCWRGSTKISYDPKYARPATLKLIKIYN